MAGEQDLILLTGATGFLGFAILVKALEAGYRVRCAIRSRSKAAKVLSTPSIKRISPSEHELSWILVPDMMTTNTYDQALQGVQYVIHAAAPVPSWDKSDVSPEQYEEYFVERQSKAIIGLFESCQRARTVRRVVATSSTTAIVPREHLFSSSDQIFTAQDRISIPPAPYETEAWAYRAGKIAALNLSEAWVKHRNPRFDLITIIPPWVFGRDELCTDSASLLSESSNSALLTLLQGTKIDRVKAGVSVLVDDLAKIHVLALNPKIEGNQAFVTSSNGIDGMVWDDIFEIVKKYFPEAVADGRLSLTGGQPTHPVRLDSRKTEDTFGIKLASYEEQVKSVVGQYLGLLKC
ncbi:hypothetical protein F5884DRAFT_876580 [Xylogone sp. PMI_703]|nr:hypothetical protein F5884DRAFT_876580 [Xylogone sp. PMI_703]